MFIKLPFRHRQVATVLIMFPANTETKITEKKRTLMVTVSHSFLGLIFRIEHLMLLQRKKTGAKL